MIGKKTKSNRGRKTVLDKKKLVRLYIKESVIKLNGGEEECSQKATDFLNTIN